MSGLETHTSAQCLPSRRALPSCLRAGWWRLPALKFQALKPEALKPYAEWGRHDLLPLHRRVLRSWGEQQSPQRGVCERWGGTAPLPHRPTARQGSAPPGSQWDRWASGQGTAGTRRGLLPPGAARPRGDGSVPRLCPTARLASAAQAPFSTSNLHVHLAAGGHTCRGGQVWPGEVYE